MNDLKFRVWDKKLKLLGNVSYIDFKNKKIQIIIRHTINLDFKATEEVLKKYIEEQEKQND